MNVSASGAVGRVGQVLFSTVSPVVAERARETKRHEAISSFVERLFVTPARADESNPG